MTGGIPNGISVLRDALHLLGKFEDQPSQWPDGPEVFPGAVNRAHCALDALVAENVRISAWYEEACRCLTSIANVEDYRGNRSGESVTAHLFLVRAGLRK